MLRNEDVGVKMELVLDLVGKIVLIGIGLAHVFLVGWGVLWYAIKCIMVYIICRKKKDCTNRTCSFRYHCDKASLMNTEELREYLEQMKETL